MENFPQGRTSFNILTGDFKMQTFLRCCSSNTFSCQEFYGQSHLFGTGRNTVGDRMLMWALEHPAPSPSRAGRILTDGGESGRVIGSCVTHAGVNDSDMSEDQGNARSASRPSLPQPLGRHGRCCRRPLQVSVHNSCGGLGRLPQPPHSHRYQLN